jgi:predicted dehydrogenase
VINRILIVGLGSIGIRHLRLARELNPGAEIRVLRRQQAAVVPESADGVCSRLEQAIEFAPQLSVIANPAPFHVSVALPLARAGSHLLIEKPLAVSAAEIPPLLELVTRARLTLLTGYNLRFVPSLDRFRRLLHEGIVGRVASVRCEVGQYLPGWRPDTDYRRGVSARRELGGGALLELSHELDYLRWIFGDVQWVRALLCTQSALELDVEDCAHLILGFSGVSSSHGPVATVNLDFIRHDPTRTCTAIGESGSLRWDGIAGVVEHFPAGAKGWNEVFRHTPERDDSYRAEWRHCMDCIASGGTPVVSGEDGLAVLDIVEAARRSAQADGGQAAVIVSREAHG